MSDDLPEPKFKALILGALPHGRVGNKIGAQLTPGVVHFSIPAQKHAFKRHPDDFHQCLPFLSEAVRSPTYVGQAPQHAGQGFELVLEVPGGGINVLVAITLKANNQGIYYVQSVYLVDNNKIRRRLRTRHLFRY